MPDPTVIRKYMTIQAAWFASIGLQMVLFPYLIAVQLGLSPEHIGLAQAIIALPAFLLMLPGGALADRFDGRSILFGTYILAAIPPTILAAVLIFGSVNYGAVLAYGIAMGTLGAFCTPARDSLLNRVVVAGGNQMPLQRAVMLSSVFMFLSQIFGMIIAFLTDTTGPAVILAIQGAILLGSIWFIGQLHLPSREKIDHGTGLSYHLGQMAEGLVEAFSNTKIMPVIVVAFCIGIFYIGSFNVILPVRLREVYGDEAWRFALMSICFFGGTIVSSVTMLRLGGVARAGRALTLSIFVGIVVLALLAIPASYFVLLCIIFSWGLGAGVAITMGRSIVQEAAAESHRGRLLAVFSMGFMGGAPLGSIVMGFLIEGLGMYLSALVPSFLMLIAISILLWRTQLWTITFPKNEHSP